MDPDLAEVHITSRQYALCGICGSEPQRERNWRTCLGIADSPRMESLCDLMSHIGAFEVKDVFVRVFLALSLVVMLCSIVLAVVGQHFWASVTFIPLALYGLLVERHMFWKHLNNDEATLKEKMAPACYNRQGRKANVGAGTATATEPAVSEMIPGKEYTKLNLWRFLWQRLRVHPEPEPLSEEQQRALSGRIRQLHLRALFRAQEQKKRLFSDPVKYGTKKKKAILSLEDVQEMVKMVKNTRMENSFRTRWLRSMLLSVAFNFCLVFVPVYSCAWSETVSQIDAWILTACNFVMVCAAVRSAAHDRDAAILGPDRGMWGAIGMHTFAWLCHSSFVLTLAYTRICDRENISQYWIQVLVFTVSCYLTTILGMFMFLGKVVDYCELRLELVALGQDWSTIGQGLARFYDGYAQTAVLPNDVAERLRQVYKGFFERWYIGVAILFLGLAPTCGKIMQTMLEGRKGNLYDLLWEEVPAFMVSTAVVVITLFSDSDVPNWMGKRDVLTWYAFAVCALATEVSGMIAAQQVSSRFEETVGIFWGLSLGMLFLGGQICTCVWAGLSTDMKLIYMFSEVDPLKIDGIQRRMESTEQARDR